MSSDVAVMDFADPTDHPVAYPVLQPILLASRRSCHGLGNWYLQEGDHHYRFSLFSHAPRLDRRLSSGHRSRMTRSSQWSRERRTPGASLPPMHGFLSVSAKNWVVTALKKCDDDDSIVLRLYDIEGKDAEGTVRFPVPLARANRASIIEDEGAGGAAQRKWIGPNDGMRSITARSETFKVWTGTLNRSGAA